METTRHRCDLPAHSFAFADEQGGDQLLRREPCLAHEGSQGLAAPQTARAVDRIAHHAAPRRRARCPSMAVASPGPVRTSAWMAAGAPSASRAADVDGPMLATSVCP